MTFVYLHLLSVLGVLILGGWQLARPKGTQPHRWIGYVTVTLFVITALSSFGIREMREGGFSLLHLLSILVLVSMAQGIRTARQGRLSAHRNWMRNTYISACIAGLFALAPGRFIATVLY